MNREIKFRAWDSENKKMLHIGKFTIYHEKDNGLHSGKENKQGDWYNLPLMQFTGLKDYDGKEIFEGDIISFTAVRDSTQKKKFEIYFDKDCGSWYCKNGSELCNILVEQNNDDWKRAQNWTIKDNQYIRVIGNIYQHSELLI